MPTHGSLLHVHLQTMSLLLAIWALIPAPPSRNSAGQCCGLACRGFLMRLGIHCLDDELRGGEKNQFKSTLTFHLFCLTLSCGANDLFKTLIIYTSGTRPSTIMPRYSHCPGDGRRSLKGTKSVPAGLLPFRPRRRARLAVAELAFPLGSVLLWHL